MSQRSRCPKLFRFDETIVAVAVDFHDFRRRERGRIVPDPFLSGKCERMFHIELQLIVTEQTQTVDQRLERLHGRHFAAGDVEHVPAVRHVRSILDEDLRHP